ncbi:MAG: agmatine deiminase family protein [Methanoregula sp.]|jgi:agmatine deiminase
MEHESVKVGLIQMAVGLDPNENIKKAILKVEQAAKDGSQIICLPELYRTRYFPQGIGVNVSSLAEAIPGDSTRVFSEIARRNKVVIIVPLFEKSYEGRYYNSAVIIDADGTLHTPYHKVHIPQDPGFFEKGYFYPGEGYQVHSTRYGRIAVLICYDQWFPEAARCVALDGAQIIFYPTAIGHPSSEEPAEGNWHEAWALIQRGHAVANSVHVAAINRVGKEGDIKFFGGSFICDAFGKIIVQAGEIEETLIATLDLSMNQSVRESWGFFRNRRPDTYGTTCSLFPGNDGAFPEIRNGDTPRNRGFHMPAEWEPHEAVWLSWPHNKNTFPKLSAVEEAYYTLISVIHSSERVELFIPTAALHRKIRARLRESHVDLSQITLHTTEYSDIWIRDYGPTFILNHAMNRAAMVCWNFNAWGGKYEDQLKDGRIPAIMNRRLELPQFIPGIVLEGGSIDVNGRGTVLTTRSCLLNPNRNPSLTEEQIGMFLQEYLGVVKIIWLNDGIVGDDTDGHIDDIARFVAPSTVVCAYETDETDANYRALQENYEILKQSSNQDGVPLTVVKLPMPAKVVTGDERYPASYTNFYIGNTVVLVPVFNDPNDVEAIRILQDLFPGRKVIGIDARAMVEGFGTFHCATQQQPRV